MAEHDNYERVGGDDLVLRALYCSMVVSYSRPFNSAGKSRIGKIRPLTVDNLTCLSAEELNIHEYLLFCRNKLVAHSDAEVIDPFPIVATDLPDALVFPEKNDALAPFTREYTALVLNLTEKTYRFFAEEQGRLESEVKEWLPSKPWLRRDASNNGP